MMQKLFKPQELLEHDLRLAIEADQSETAQDLLHQLKTEFSELEQCVISVMYADFRDYPIKHLGPIGWAELSIKLYRFLRTLGETDDKTKTQTPDPV